MNKYAILDGLACPPSIHQSWYVKFLTYLIGANDIDHKKKGFIIV